MNGYAAALLCGLALGAGRGMADEAAPAPVESRIREVTVYADRARVVRGGDAALAQGEQVLSFGKLPGWIDAESVRVAVEPAAGNAIVDVQVKREFLAQADNPDVRKAQAALREIEDQVAELDDETKVLDAKAAQVESIKVFAMEKLPKDAALGTAGIESYAKAVEFVSATLREVAAARRRLAARRRDLEPELAARQRRVSEVQGLTQLEESTVLLRVAADRAGKAALSLTYMLPGATWEPSHELRWSGTATGSVSITSYATVTQTTGEDWNGAGLSFSTQSPEEASEIPEVEALLLGAAPAAALRQAKGSSSFSKAQALYMGKNTAWYNWRNPDVALEKFNLNLGVQFELQGRATESFKALQQRGTTAHFRALSAARVRSDGAPVRVPIGEVELAATPRIVAAPQASLNATRTATMANTGVQPLLPGRVRLYQGGAFLGSTDVGFAAKGEEFDLFMGVADQIKLSRVLDRKRSSLTRGRRTRMQVTFVITAQNLSGQPVTMELVDRVPVSEHRDITVDRVKLDPEATPDGKGLVKWTPTLAPGEERTFTIEYRIEYPPEAVAVQAAPAAADPFGGAGGAKPDAGQIMEDIKHLELSM